MRNARQDMCIVSEPLLILVSRMSGLTDPERCSLTFLAIQESGISKYCSLCEREFFDEIAYYNRLKVTHSQDSNDKTIMEIDNLGHGGKILPQPTQGGEPSPLSANGLFWKLFRIFDTCPYCGGKYFSE